MAFVQNPWWKCSFSKCCKFWSTFYLFYKNSSSRALPRKSLPTLKFVTDGRTLGRTYGQTGVSFEIVIHSLTEQEEEEDSFPSLEPSISKSKRSRFRPWALEVSQGVFGGWVILGLILAGNLGFNLAGVARGVTER